MSYTPLDLNKVKVLADSVWYPKVTDEDQLTRTDYTPKGFRITTFELTFPRCVLSEFNTHCQLGRNSASSRAIKTQLLIDRVEQQPFVPMQFSKAGPGMSAAGYWVPGDEEYDLAVEQWLEARDAAVVQVKKLLMLGVHKQDVNRLLEPFMWHTVIATATWQRWDWPNFILLRASDQADPKIARVAHLLKTAADRSMWKECEIGEWHLPLIGFDRDVELSLAEKIKVSVARVARTSYLTHEGQRDVSADLELYEKLRGNGHLSPAEQALKAEPGRHGKYTGWRAARTWVENGLEVEV